jgi:LuxR family maltose regulon positive regulatory protein
VINTLLQTKLYLPPTRTTIVPRSRLTDQLTKGLNGKLTFVSAPAGFGKTTLITDWLSQLEHSIAWVSLDEDDSNPQQFFSYVAAAIRSFSSDLQTLSSLLQSPQPQPFKALATALINDCTAVAAPCLLVLDDYHAVESVDIDRALAFLLDHMPPNLHLVMTSRSDPGFPLSRLRARNQLTEIRANDLRFSTEEAAVFLQSVMGLTLSPEQIAALEARTEGWAAGLQMAALSMQNQNDLTAFVTSFTGSHRFIMDYLVEEVLNQQSVEVQDFLIETSVLTRLCADLCDTVHQSTSSQQILEQLETDNIFLIPLDNERHWYRYHHLFADLLRSRLAQGQPERVPQLHQRASDWYAANGRSTDAIRHAVAANDFERAAQLMELVWSVIHTHRSDPWWQWLDLLPDSVVRLRPVLIVSYAWAHLIFNSERDACERRLQEAEQWLKRSEAEREALGMVVVDEEKFKMLPVTIASARAIAALVAGNTVSAINHARQALDLLPEEDHLGRTLPELILGLSYFANGELLSATETLRNSFNSSYGSGNTITAISMKSLLVDIQKVQGRLHDARQTCERALQLVASAQDDLNLRGTANLLLSVSEIHRQQGDSKTAADYWQQSDSLGKQTSNSTYQYRRRLALADMKVSQGAFDEALDLLDEAAPWLEQVHLTETRTLAALKANVWIKQGQLDKTLAWVNQQGLAIDDKLSYLHEFDYMTLARLSMAQYQNGHGDEAIHQAVRLLGRLLQAAEAGKRNGSIIEILILQALAHEAQDNISAALSPLTKALTLARPESYVRIFVDEGPAMARLLAEAAVRGMMPDYCGKLLAVFEAEGQKGEANSFLSAKPTAPSLPDPLTPSELKVLKLLATALTGPEIARELMVSVNTTRTHTKNIYAKLGVNSRRTAVSRAEELRLL